MSDRLYESLKLKNLTDVIVIDDGTIVFDEKDNPITGYIMVDICRSKGPELQVLLTNEQRQNLEDIIIEREIYEDETDCNEVLGIIKDKWGIEPIQEA